MGKILGIAVAGVVALGLGTAASAAPSKVRVRGTIESVNGNAVTIKAYNGRTVDLTLQPGTKYGVLTRASLKDIKPGDFVGIGATGPTSHLVALEVLIFPNSMRGAGEGHYGWSVPAAVARIDRPGAATTGAPMVRGTMTNGTVAANTGGASGTELTVTYDHGGKVRILVPASAPVVRLAPAKRSIVKPDEKAFAVASRANGRSGLDATFVSVGQNGLIPPM